MVFNSQGAVNLGSAFGSIVVDMRDTERDINAQVRNLENGISRSMQRIGDRLQSIGAKLTLTLSPVTLFATRGLAAYAEFDDILTEIAARTGATADEMERVRTTALQMGQDTAFSANQAADAMLQLLSSGYDLEQTFLALQPVLDLAAAGALDLGYAADAVTDILSQFQLGADKATEVSDALAQASGASSATISQLIDAFANVGPLASNFRLSVGDTAAILALFAENGIKGADAGTQLKSMLTNLSRDVPEVQRMWEDLGVSLYDSNGNFRDLNTVIEDLAVAMADMTDEERNNAIQTLAGSYGQMGLQILLAAEGYDEMAAAMEGAATASELAAARMESFRGKINQARSSVATFMLHALAPLVEKYLEPAIEKFIQFINRINELLMVNPQLAEAFGLVIGVLAVLGPGLVIVGTAINIVAAAVGGLALAFGVLTSPITLVIGAGAALGYLIYSRLLPALDDLRERFNAWGGVERVVNTFNDLRARVDELLEPLGGLENVLGIVGRTILGILVPPLGMLMSLISLVQLGLGVLSGEANDTIRRVGDFFSQFGEAAEEFIQSIPERLTELAESFVAWVEPMIPQLIQALTQIGQAIITWVGQTIPLVFNAMLRFGAAFLAWLGPVIRELLPRLGQMFGDIIQWIIGTGLPALIEILADVGAAFVEWIVDAIPKILPALGEFLVALGNFIFRDLIPGVVAFGGEIVNGLLQGLANLGAQAAEWIRSVDWLALGGSILTGIADGIGDVVSWVYNNVIVPMAEGVAAYVGSGQLWEDLKSLGSGIFNAIGEGIRALGTVAMWVYNNIIVPLANGIIAYVTSGQLWDNLVALGTAIFDGIAFGLKSLADIATWVYAKVILPIALGIRDYITSGQLWDDLVALGEGIFNAIGAGIAAIGDLAEWVLNNLIVPLGNAVLEYVGSGKLWDDLGNLGKSILDGLAAGLGAVTDWVNANIIEPILGPLREAQRIVGDILGWDTTVRIGDSNNSAVNPGNLFAPGTRDSGGPGRRGGLYHVGQGQIGHEAFIAGDSGHFYPDFAEHLARIAGMVMKQNVPQPAPAFAGGGGGNVYNLEINIPLDVLRDEPNLQRNADTFADQLMSRLRSK